MVINCVFSKAAGGSYHLFCQLLVMFTVFSASPAQNHPHDSDQQDHEDQATEHWQAGQNQYKWMTSSN